MPIFDNPFSGRGAPVSGSRLVGRNSLIQRLVSRVQMQAHCSIVGLPRMGKTSVARETNRLLHQTAPNMINGYITLDAISGPIQAYLRIVEETSLSDHSEQFLNRINEHDEAYETFLRTLRKRRRGGQKSLIIIDEFDAIARDTFEDAQLFISRIREVANDCDRYGLTFMFVSRRSLDRIQGAVDCSTLAGLCEVIYLQPLSATALNELATRSPVPIDNSGQNALWRITGGHPYLAEVVMCEAVEQNTPILNNTIIESAQYTQSLEFTTQYRQLSLLLSYEEMFATMCELIIGPRWRAISPYNISTLKHYGILRSSDDPAGGLDCMSEHLRDYLALINRTMPSWVLLGDTEQQLRSLIQDRMYEAYGAEWFETIRSKHTKLLSALDKLLDQRLKEKKMFGAAASEFILDYAYIGDLKNLIFVEWEAYRSLLGGSKADWEKRFQDVMRVRNPMAHHRPVPADVLQEAELSCKAILGRLNGVKKQ